MVESAEEALAALEKTEFLMVITDARLGKMSGYEFLGPGLQTLAQHPLPHDHRLRHPQAGGRGHQSRRH